MNHTLSAGEQKLETGMLTALAEHADKHINQSDGKLSLLDIDSERYPAQALHTFYIESNPVESEVVDGIGNLVMRNYSEIAEGLQQDEQGDRLREAGEFMKAGGSVVAATTHDNLIDPGVVLGTLYSALHKQGYENFETGIMLFKMISLLGYRFKPEMEEAVCIDVLKMFCNRTYLTITRSDSVRESGLMDSNPDMPAHVNGFNAEAKQSVDSWQADGRVLLAQAPSASVHRWNGERTECVLPRVTTGTAKIMAHPNARVLPVTFDLVRGGGFMEICGDLRQLDDPEEAHEVMEDMTAALNDRSEAAGDGRPHVYAPEAS